MCEHCPGDKYPVAWGDNETWLPHKSHKMFPYCITSTCVRYWLLVHHDCVGHHGHHPGDQDHRELTTVDVKMCVALSLLIYKAIIFYLPSLKWTFTFLSLCKDTMSWRLMMMKGTSCRTAWLTWMTPHNLSVNTKLPELCWWTRNICTKTTWRRLLPGTRYKTLLVGGTEALVFYIYNNRFLPNKDKRGGTMGSL